MRNQLTKVLQEQDEAEEINMTPMLDVVFILLIFFIVTASFVKESGIEVNRPEAATAVKKERANILVAISDKGDIWINKRRIDIRAVQANIERLKAENPQGTVVIQADKKSTTEVLIKVMDSARAAGVFDVSIAAEAG
ncbi:biopolymer transporter ExbD [Thalassotalea sp. 42_200_T64]|mgnify:CR=1 FL=1|nr:biopolymer transporter ExbD [Thalassotalea sp. 42_200_T64]